MKAIFILLLLIAAPPIFAASPNEKWESLISDITLNPNFEAPKEIKKIMDSLKISGTQINLRGFKEVKIDELKKRIPEDYLIYSIGNDLLASDSFIYVIIKEVDSDSFWIVKKGGYAGVFKIYRKRPIQSS
ncbi:hypothetical protein QEH52_19450 [Coraliomargarita sp. SDUM461003]|uniref:Uncharacterized protein n=1 Tax=Thalassobacterium maritimum TaxID=3041265 RepID=A0ABU1AZZ1_9BACT|nr:hypothetical protein [Coraliomargarita sp. SDUM461003]MDQ8209703.1 hypothetical protein [Coraliomargarita sp. SDUM461003]